MSESVMHTDLAGTASRPLADRFWVPLLAQPADRAMSKWEWWGRWLFAGLLVGTAPIVLSRTINNGGSDFYEYYVAGRYIVEHGVRQPNSILAYYWPSMDVAWAGLAWMPLSVAAAVWFLIGCVCWIGLLNAVGRYLLPDLDDTRRRQALLATGLLVMPIAILHACLGAFHILMLWWMVAGLGRVSQGRAGSGGLLLGLAVWLKLLPLLGVGYLLLKRQWRPAILAVVYAVAIDVALSVAVLGPQATWEWHQTWWRQEARGASQRVLASTQWAPEHRFKNQSLAMVSRRVLTQAVCDPGRQPDRIAWADLSTRQVTWVYYGLAGLLGLGILAVCRRPASQTSPRQWATEIGLLTLSTMWFSPVVWSYHNTAVTPALGVVLGRETRHRRLAWLTAVLWLAAMALFASRYARGLGMMLWMSLALGAILVWTGRANEVNGDE